jgi:adenosylhomocysteine nucleosidase
VQLKNLSLALARKAKQWLPANCHARRGRKWNGEPMRVNAVFSNPADKQKLHALTGAVAVDLESHLVARLAASHGLAFAAAVRVVIDPADRTVPPAALLTMAPGGSTDISSMLWDTILARPSQLSLLLRLAADAYAARTALVLTVRARAPL